MKTSLALLRYGLFLLVTIFLPLAASANELIATTNDASAGKSPFEANRPQDWAYKCLRDFQSITNGMSREDVEARFPQDGGLQGFSMVRFTHPDCRYFKVDVEFGVKRDAVDQNRVISSKDDKVIRVSKPYLESPFSD